MIADYIDQIIMFCVGLWVAAVGFGWLPLPGDHARHPAWVMTVARQFKWMGPLLLVIAVLLAVLQQQPSSM